MENFKIIFNGSSGSIGNFMPKNKNFVPLRFRVEDSFDTICDEIKFYNSNALIHLAGIVPIEECENNPEKCFNINVKGSEKIFKAANKVGVNKFVYVSTSHVYKLQKKFFPIDIDAEINPISIYAKSKLLTENRLISLSKELPNTKLSIARVFSVLSKLMKKSFLLTSIHKMAKTKNFRPINGLNNVRDFLWAEEVCEKLVSLCYSKNFPPLVNICSGKPTKIKDLVYSIFKQYGIDDSKIIHPKKKEKSNFLVGVPSKF